MERIQERRIMSKLYIGVDPGKSGAIAFIPEDGEPWFIKTNETLQDISDALNSAWGVNGRLSALIEKVHSSPQMGVKSAFTFGESYGQLTALLVAHGIPYDTVRPQAWQKAMQCMTKGDKNITKAKAQSLFPGMKITHANADALLIAEHCRRNLRGDR